MPTLRLTATPGDLTRAAEILRSGGLVAFSTETVYGLGASALDQQAVARIFAAKQRPSWDPVIVHIAGPVNNNPMLAEVTAEIPTTAQKLMEAFWPGPLTLLLPRAAAVPHAVTAGRRLVGVRMPAHPVAFELIRLAGIPIAAPSANRFGHTSPTTAEHVLEDLDGRIDAVVDAGPTLHGVESTVLDPTQNPVVVYRPGAVTLEQIRSVAGEAVLYESALTTAPAESLPSPGVGIRHYAPKAHLILIDAPEPELPAVLFRTALNYLDAHAGILLPEEFASAVPNGIQIFRWGNWRAPEELAARLYAGLRELDASGCEVILAPLPAAEGIGAALRDRLRKAAWKP
jgi:L-threonylcarbamoyladenylate synthase